MKIWRNRLMLLMGIIAMLMLVAIAVDYRIELVSFLPWAQTEGKWDPIAAGYRIEEKVPGVDVLHIGPIGGYPEREEMAVVVMAAAEVYFSESADNLDEETTFDELGVTPEAKEEFGELLVEAIGEGTRYVTYINREVLQEEIETLGELVDWFTEHSAQNVGMLGATPRFHVALLYKAPDLTDSQYAVTIIGLDSDGNPITEILEPGEYVWDDSDPLNEDIRFRWSTWTLQKWAWFSEHDGVFPPDRQRQASLSILDLYYYLEMKEFWVPLYSAIFREAYHYEEVIGEEFWHIIEVDFLQLGELEIAPGISMDGKPGYVGHRDYTLLGTRFFARGWSYYDFINPRHVYKITEYHLDHIFKHEDRDLTVEETRDILADGRKSIYQWGYTAYGPIPYIIGFNHPWQALDMPT